MVDTSRKAVIEFVAENRTKTAIDEISRGVRSVGDEAAKAGDKAGAAFSGMGKSSEDAAVKFTRSEAVLATALRRSIEQMEIATRQSQGLAEAFEFKIDARGFDASKFNPMLGQLRSLEQQLDLAKAAEAEFAAQDAFAKKHQQVAGLAKANQYTSWWAQELAKVEAAEVELAAQNAFGKKHQQAAELVKASQYASWWAQELDKVEAAERRLASQDSFVKSLKSQSDAIGKTRADLLEMQAAQMGVSGQAAPFIAKLREAEKGVGGLGVSAGQTRAALAQLPMQFSDIVVSLQGGQAPMTVFLQQGAQIKDSFGGAGAAAQALGKYVLGLVSPTTLLAAGVAALGVAYYQGSKEQDAFVKAIVLTGNASGMTSSQLREYARQIDAVVGTQAQAAAGLTAFTAAGVRGGDELRRYTQTAIEWEKTTGQAVEKTAEQFSSLQKDPLSAVIKLNEGTNFLTVSVYEQIKALEAQGDKTGAAEVAMNALDAAMRERGKSIQESLGYIERGWAGIKGGAAEAWDAMLGVGRAKTNRDMLAEAQAQLDARMAKSSVLGDDDSLDKGNSKIRARIAALRDLIAQEELGAAIQADSVRTTQARIEFDKKYAKQLEGEVSLQQKLKVARTEAEAAGKSEADIKKVLAAITEEHNKKGASAAKAYNKELTAQQKLIAELSGLSTDFYQDWERLNKMFARGGISLAGLEKEQAKLLSKQPYAIALAKEETEVTKARVKAYEDDVKVREKLLHQHQDAAKKAQESVQRAKEEEEAYALAASAGITLAEAVAVMALARADDNYQKALAKGLDAETLLALQQELDARREIVAVMGQKGVREASQKAQEQMGKDWHKTSQLMGDTLADYIMGGGKDAAQYLKRLFATLVLQPVVNYGAQAALGAVGLGGASNASGSSLLGTASNVSSLSNLSSLASLGSVGGALSGFGTAMTASLQTLAGITGTTSQMVASLAAAGHTAAPGMASGAAAFNAIPGWGWALGAGLAVLSQLDLGSRGANHSGAAASSAGIGNDAAALQVFGMASGDWYGDVTSRHSAGMETQLAGTVNALSGVYKQLAGYAGDAAREIDLVGAFAVNGKHSDEDVYGYGQIRDALTGEILAKFNNRELGTDANAAWATYIGQMGGLIVDQLKAADIPGWMRGVFDGLGDTITVDGLNAALQQIALIDAGFKSLGQSMVMFTDLTADMQTRLLGVAGGIDALDSAASAYYQGLYSEEERMQSLSAQLQGVLGGLGSAIDPRMGEEAKAQFRAAVEGAMEAGQAELAYQLMAMSGSFVTAAEYAQKSAEAAAQAAETAAQAAVDAWQKAQDAIAEWHQGRVDSAFANLQAAVGREKSYWQEIATASQTAVSTLTGTLGLLTSNAAALYGTVDQAAQWQAASGMVYIEDALAAVRGGASATDYTGLTDAIGAARNGISNGVYASQFDKDRDALVLAGQLSELGELADSQLGVEERQLRAAQSQIEQLDQTLSYWQQQIDGTDKLIDVGLSVGGSLSALISAIAARDAAKAGVTGAAGAGGAASATGDAFLDSVLDYGSKYGSDAYYFIPGVNDYAAKQQSINDIAAITGQSASDLWGSMFGGLGADYWQAVQNASNAGAVVNASDSLDDILRKAGVPGYAVGANYIPNDQLAFLHKGEAVVPAPFNPWAGGMQRMLSGNGMGGNTERLEQLVEKVAVELQRLQTIVGEGNRAQSDLLDITDQKSEGGSADRVRITNVQELAVAIKEVMA